ncbi:1,4-dihydroxy-2-naphthoate octaprenyltransferase [Candidatus Methanoplasma termitum]|uniref:1,4-dihydroxy-2-naphthoate octaprenyltransferase n=1 Tax=Candidatus Methanoplasma termitum TaxID=1577791 RepID=A0A0A7LFN0_9ARCH|nr:1,4-dihydroxy-2-naphthoate octaprenyltransferase [Candidatus Methanoplasma termitum]AIZ56306.1 1,4-dihydroxy-2-naphthoate octaprenyltransferase [Candidatus Methanoplasma termitum]
MADVKSVRPGWYNAFRPWSLHGAVIPVLIGGAVAYYDGYLDQTNWWIFVMVLICGILLQSAANLLNTYGDYVRGTDTVDTLEDRSRSPELVTGTLRPKAIFMAGLACLGITALCGVVFIWYIGWGILFFGILGIAGAGLYTVGISYKYHAMGLISVFFMMGILMPLGTYYVLSGEMSYVVLLMSLPNAFVLTAVLSGNETRDYYEDKQAGVRTLSSFLSYEGSLRLYLVLNAIAFPVLLVLIVFQTIPWACALAFITLINMYLLYGNAKGAPNDKKKSRLLVPLSFRMNWHFGLLLVAGYLIGQYIIPGAF